MFQASRIVAEAVQAVQGGCSVFQFTGIVAEAVQTVLGGCLGGQINKTVVEAVQGWCLVPRARVRDSGGYLKQWLRQYRAGALLVVALVFNMCLCARGEAVQAVQGGCVARCF